MVVEYIEPSELIPYANNTKIHNSEQVEQIKESIKEFGFNDPIAIWKDNEVIEGHGRLIAALELGIEKVPVIRLDGLSNDQRKAYAIIHNKLTTDTGFDIDLLNEEIEAISGVDLSKYGIESTDEIDFDGFYEDDKREIVCEHCGHTFYVNSKGEIVE